MRRKFQVVCGVWKLIVLLTLMLIAFLYAMFQGGFVSWFLFYSFLPFALYAVCLAFYSLGGFSIERQLPKREYHSNEPLTIKVILKRKTFFPLLLLVAEDCLSRELADSVFQKKNKTFLFPGFRKELTFEYDIKKLPRGEHFLPALRLLTCDVLGLIQKEELFHTDEKILVYPAYKEMSYKPFENDFDQGGMTLNDRVQRDTTMAVGIREYQPGDRLSWINWKASAKRSEIMMKEFEQRGSHDLMLIMDCVPHPAFELLVQYTASIGRTALRKGAQVGFLSVGEERIIFPPQGGETSQRQLFYHLAKSKDLCPVSLEQVLSTENYLLQQKVTLLLVTAQLSRALVEAAGRFTARKCPVTIFVIKDVDDSLTSSEASMKEMARARGINVQFLHGPLFSAGLKKAVKG